PAPSLLSSRYSLPRLQFPDGSSRHQIQKLQEVNVYTCIRCAVVAFLAAAITFSQVAGRISGQILDRSPAAVPNAQVVAENTGTGVSTKALSDSQGRYVFASLPIGLYRVTAEAAGFQKQ